MIINLINLAQLVFCLFFVFDYPLWDALYYHQCVKDVVDVGFTWDSLSCYGHTSYLYIFLSGVILKVFKYFWALNIFNMLLFIFATRCFYDLLNFFWDEKKNQIEKALATLLLAFHPIYLGPLLNFNIDIGIFCFAPIFMWSLLREKYYQSIIYSLMLIFSKANGGVIFGIILGTYTIFYFKNKGWKSIIKIWPSFVGMFCYVSYLLWPGKTKVGGWSNLLNDLLKWENFKNIFFSFNLENGFFKEQLGVSFILQFTWPLWLAVLLGVILSIIDKSVEDKKNNVFSKKDFFYFNIIVALAIVYINTRIETFVNPRYFTVQWFPLILAFVYAISLIAKNIYIKRGIYSLMCGLLIASNFKMIDPISKKFWGVFYAGGHRFLSMTSVSKSCCGHGRDQLVYSLEYHPYSKMITKFYDWSIYYSKNIPIYFANMGHDGIIQLNPRGKHFLERKPGYHGDNYPNKFIIYPGMDELVKQDGFYYHSIPHMNDIPHEGVVDDKEILRDIRAKFAQKEEIRFYQGNYYSTVYRFEKT